MRLGAGSLVLAADLAGIFVFAAEGALAAMRGNLAALIHRRAGIRWRM
jgi:hypothetical protein